MPDQFTIFQSERGRASRNKGQDLEAVTAQVSRFVEEHGDRFLLEALGGDPRNPEYWYPPNSGEALGWLVDIIKYHRYVDSWRKMRLTARDQSNSFVMVSFEGVSQPAQAMEG